MTETTKPHRSRRGRGPRPIGQKSIGSSRSSLSPEAQAALNKARRLAAEYERSPEGKRKRFQQGREAQVGRIELYPLQLTSKTGEFDGYLVVDRAAARQADAVAGRKRRNYRQMAAGTQTMAEAFLNAHANVDAVGSDCVTINELRQAVIDYAVIRLADRESYDEADLPTDQQIATAIRWYEAALRWDGRQQAAKAKSRGASQPRRTPRKEVAQS